METRFCARSSLNLVCVRERGVMGKRSREEEGEKGNNFEPMRGRQLSTNFTWAVNGPGFFRPMFFANSLDSRPFLPWACHIVTAHVVLVQEAQFQHVSTLNDYS